MKTKLLALLLVMSPAISQAMCPIPPIPPVNCRVGPCVCDQNGQNCQYQMICK